MDLTQQWHAPASSAAGAARSRVEYRLAGVRLEADAVDCGDIPFEQCDPVRTFPNWRLKRHYDGYHWMGALGTTVGFESLTERAFLIELDRTPGVVAVASQPMWIRWVLPTGQREHAPDYFVRLESGQAVLIDVNPAAHIDDDVREQFDTTARFAADRGWWYVVYDAESQVRMANLRFLAPFRNWGDGDELPSLPAGRQALAEAAAVHGVGADGYAHCYARLWSGSLETDLDQPLGLSTLVWERSASCALQ